MLASFALLWWLGALHKSFVFSVVVSVVTDFSFIVEDVRKFSFPRNFYHVSLDAEINLRTLLGGKVRRSTFVVFRVPNAKISSFRIFSHSGSQPIRLIPLISTLTPPLIFPLKPNEQSDRMFSKFRCLRNS